MEANLEVVCCISILLMAKSLLPAACGRIKLVSLPLVMPTAMVAPMCHMLCSVASVPLSIFMWKCLAKTPSPRFPSATFCPAANWKGKPLVPSARILSRNGSVPSIFRRGTSVCFSAMIA